jgi:putative CocE/NonD family hydrolase
MIDISKGASLQRRGILACLTDRIVLWLLGFPPERCSYTTHDVCIPISAGLDRIELAGALLQPVRPDNEGPLGTVLQVSPYGRGFGMSLNPRAYAARGYQVLMVSSRGTFGSGGTFDPFRNDVEDGKGIVEWMRKQSWYTGSFATIGGSYLSFTQWALMIDPPRDMVAAVTTVSVHDPPRAFWDTGSLNLDVVRWAGHVSTQEKPSFTWKSLTRPKLERVIRSVPLAQNVRSYLGDEARWVDRIITTPDVRDSYYAPMRLGKALERIEIPVLIVTGWYDIFLEQSIEQYHRLKERGCPVAMTAGPWSHVRCPLSGKANRAGFDWIDHHLGGREEVRRNSAVEYFVTGAQKWRRTSTYPPPTASCVFYLGADGKLTNKPTLHEAGFSTFVFDPANPTPTIGGNALLSSGAVNDSALAKRSDVLVFDSDPLDNDLEFCGKVTIQLAHTSSHPPADVFVRVSEVKKNGSSINVTEAYKRLGPERAHDELVGLDLHDASHRFLRGRRIRVLIAGGNFPRYARNLGIGDNSNNSDEMRSVKHSVRFSNSTRIQFPVVSVS